jgi:multidrug efflux pump subunit AcrA (membrane-fusion protein)
MFGKVEVILGVKDHALTIPEEAIVQEQGGQGVFVVKRSKVVRFSPVMVGLSSAGQVEILTGLNEDDQVVVVGQNRLRDGQEVQLLSDGGRSEHEGYRHHGGRRKGHRRGGEGR